jgi:hypothetical protein
VSWPPSGLRVLAAQPAELVEHQATLEAISREAKGLALWARLEPAATEAGGGSGHFD